LHRNANPAYLKGLLFSGLLRVAPYCVLGGIRVVSGRATATVRQQVRWQALATCGATIRCHSFLWVAVGCRIGFSKLFSWLVVARCFCVLHAQWCQKWCQMSSDPCACNTVGCAEDRYWSAPNSGQRARIAQAETIWSVRSLLRLRTRSTAAPTSSCAPRRASVSASSPPRRRRDSPASPKLWECSRRGRPGP
jgi:hypothetical protein